MKLSTRLSRGRESLNSVTKSVGNRIYDGFGDVLTKDVDARGLAKIGVASVVLGVAGLVGGCGNGNSQYSTIGTPATPSWVADGNIARDKIRYYNLDSLLTDTVFIGFLLGEAPTYKYALRLRNESKVVIYSDLNENGTIERGEVSNMTGAIDISRKDFLINNNIGHPGEYLNIITNPLGEKIFEERISSKGINHIYSTNLFRVKGHKDNVRNVSWIANEVIKNPGIYTFTAAKSGVVQSNKLNLVCSDPTKIAGRTGIGQVESIGSNKD